MGGCFIDSRPPTQLSNLNLDEKTKTVQPIIALLLLSQTLEPNKNREQKTMLADQDTSQPVEEGFDEDVMRAFGGGGRARQPQDPDDDDADADDADADAAHESMMHVPGRQQQRHSQRGRGVRE